MMTDFESRDDWERNGWLPAICYLTHHNAKTRRTAAWDVLEDGDVRALEPLLEMLDWDLDVDHAGLAALQVITLRCLRHLGDSVAIEFLCAALKNPTLLYMRRGCTLPSLLAKALAKAGYGDLTKPLCEALKEHDCELIWAVQVLGEIGSPRAVKPLCMVLETGSPWTRMAAVHALCQIHDLSAFTPLCRVPRRQPV